MAAPERETGRYSSAAPSPGRAAAVDTVPGTRRSRSGAACIRKLRRAFPPRGIAMNAATPLAPPRADWALKLFALVLGLFAAALAIGGGWLLALGGSWYYLVAGVLLLASALQLWRGRRLGATLFWIALALTVAWAAWESGLDYWRWVPRLGLLVAFALVLALLLPRLPERPARPALARGLAGAFALVFVVAFALAFVPHGVTRGGAVPAPHALAPAAGVAGAQPKDAPAPGDWAAYGRD